MSRMPAKDAERLAHKSVYLHVRQWRALAEIMKQEPGRSEAEVIRYIVDLGLKAYTQGEPEPID